MKDDDSMVSKKREELMDKIIKEDIELLRMLAKGRDECVKKLLFICHSNQNRSPTAEQIFKENKKLSVKSAGLYEGSKRFVDEELVEWADMIFVMEDYQKTELLRRFPKVSKHKPIIVLDIEDVYDYMELKLISLLKEKMKLYFY